MTTRTAKGLPATVERYVKEHLDDGADEGKAWALAWSRYCKYKNPNSPRCHQEDYFTGRKASALRVAEKFLAAGQEGEWELRGADRQRINGSLTRAGFDGNTPWEGLRGALRALGRVLKGSGLRVVEPPGAGELSAPSGRLNLAVEWDTPAGSAPVNLTLLAFHWAELEAGSHEVVAYLS